MGDIAKGCTSGRHETHTFVPWMWNHPYNKKCDICGESAAWAAGDKEETPLCDCHAEDFHRFNDHDNRLKKSGRRLKTVWNEVYRDFKARVISGDFVPNDFT